MSCAGMKGPVCAMKGAGMGSNLTSAFLETEPKDFSLQFWQSPACFFSALRRPTHETDENTETFSGIGLAQISGRERLGLLNV